MAVHICWHVSFPEDSNFQCYHSTHLECGKFTSTSAAASAIIVIADGQFRNILNMPDIIIIFYTLSLIVLTMLRGKFLYFSPTPQEWDFKWLQAPRDSLLLNGKWTSRNLFIYCPQNHCDLVCKSLPIVALLCLLLFVSELAHIFRVSPTLES